MTENEIREAVRKWNESTELHNVNWVHTLGDFAEEYLKVEGWPEERVLEYVNFERLDNPSFIVGEEWNQALRLCKLANLKDYNNMRMFQEKFINADQELRAMKKKYREEA